jgi:hypothetical protein
MNARDVKLITAGRGIVMHVDATGRRLTTDPEARTPNLPRKGPRVRPR